MLARKHAEALNEIYRAPRKNFVRRPYKILSLDDVIQFDIADLTWLLKSNSGFRYLLVAVNPFSKMIYARALKSKGAEEVSTAAKSIIDQTGIKFKKIFTDRQLSI